mgnify:CR=1 FL=1
MAVLAVAQQAIVSPQVSCVEVRAIGTGREGLAFARIPIRRGDELDLAAINAPSACLISGPEDAVESIVGTAQDFCLVTTQRRHVDDTALVVTGRAARDWLGQALTGRFVVVRSSDVSPDGHIRGRLLFKNQDPGTTLLYQGLAWCVPQPDGKAVSEYRDAQTDARAARRGLWSDASPVPPWEWPHSR